MATNRSRVCLALLWMLAASALGCGDDAEHNDAGSGGSAGGGAGSDASDSDANHDEGAEPGPDQNDASTGEPTGPVVWAQPGYDARNTFHNPREKKISVENAADLEQKWVFEVAGVPNGAPIIAEGLVFVSSSGGVYAIDLESGDERWSTTMLTSVSSSTYHDGTIFVHTQEADLYRLDAQSGEILWGPVRTYELAGSDGTSSPIVGDGKVLVGHSTSNEIFAPIAQQNESRGGVEAFDIETGEREWTYATCDAPENGAMVWSSVTIDEETGVGFATTGNNYRVAGAQSDAIHAFDLADGSRLWSTQVREGDVWVAGLMGAGEDTDFGANPILAEIDGRKVVAAGDKGSAFWVLDRETGDIVWSRPDLSAGHTASTGGVLNNGAYDGERFYVASNEPPASAVLHALNLEDGSDAWPPKTIPATVWGMLTVANGVLFVPANTQLQVLNAATGDMLTSFETSGTIAAGGPSIVDGHVVVASGLSYPYHSSPVNNRQVYCYALPD